MCITYERVLITQKAKEVDEENTTSNGMSNNAEDFALWDRTMGCQIRSTREIKKGDVLMKVPRTAMITPDLLAMSDAGAAVRSCMKVKENGENLFWMSFRNTAEEVERYIEQVSNQNGTQLLVKILQWRKKAESKYLSAWKAKDSSNDINEEPMLNMCEEGSITTRAPILAFLIQQRFSCEEYPQVSNASEDQSNAKSFAPYARSLPSFVSLPISWKRNQLALLTSSITGMNILQEVAAHTLLLSNELCSLIDAGLLTKFPNLFPRGSLTWENWVWACSIFMSRNLPMEMCIEESKVDTNLISIWKELGVMVPFLDMLNHERDMNQVTWVTNTPEDSIEIGDNGSASTGANEISEHPRAISHKRIKKAAQIFTNYGIKSNHSLLFDYGFAQIGNTDDKVSVGWGLVDCVDGQSNSENSDSSAIQSWWNISRLGLLTKQALRGEESLSEQLRSGKKLINDISRDGVFHPILLTASVIGTMPVTSVESNIDAITVDPEFSISITKSHQRKLRIYLREFLSRKLESLLTNLSQGLKVHYKHVKIWTKIENGGLYHQDETTGFISWQKFFDCYAYETAIEIEKRYYSMGTDSCVLTLFDGHLKSLQTCIDKTDEEQFQSILDQLTDLGFILSDKDEEKDGDVSSDPKDDSMKVEQEKVEEEKVEKDKLHIEKIENKHEKKSQDQSPPRKSKVNVKKADRHPEKRPKSNKPTLKLHIGNLPYSTTPPSLFDYFAKLFGKENIIECHIPAERGSGKSRGFGFVTMPEEAAFDALQPGRVYEIEGRVVKLAKSNAASNKGNGSSKKPNNGSNNNSQESNGRCQKCGFRPKYCDCRRPPEMNYARRVPPPYLPERSDRPYYDAYGPNYGNYPPPPMRRRSPSPRYRVPRDPYEYGNRRAADIYPEGSRRRRSLSLDRDRRERMHIEEDRRRRPYRSISRSRSRSREQRGRRSRRSWSRSPSPRLKRDRSGSVERRGEGSRRRGREDDRRIRPSDRSDDGDDKRSISSEASRERNSKRKKKRKHRSRRRNRSMSRRSRSRSRSRSAESSGK